MPQYLKIVVPTGSRLSRIAAEKLTDYLSKVSGESYPVIADKAEVINDDIFVIIGNEKRNRFSRKIGFSYDWSKMRPDGYVLKTINKNGKKYIIAAGNDEIGDKYAIYRLIKELKVEGKKISIENYEIALNPFIKTREVFMGDADHLWDPFVYEDEVPKEERGVVCDIIDNTLACQLNFPDTPASKNRKKAALWRILKKYCIENWEKEKLVRYMDQMDVYGFNSIQFCDLFESYFASGCFVTRREWREKLLEMMKRTRELGNRISLQLWADAVFVFPGKVISDWDDPLCDEKAAFPKGTLTTFCWNDKKERKNIQAAIKYLSGYAPYVDHIVTHFNDPGGCRRNGCTIGSCIEIMNYQYHAFKKINPGIKATYNLWPLTSNFPGYRMVDLEGARAEYSSPWRGTYSFWYFTKVVDKLDPSIMVANRKYTAQIADYYCKKWNRKYGIWSWYNCDQEIVASLHVEAERLGREFAELPGEASRNIEWFSVPSNCHSLNSASLYIASSLLWEPKRNPFEILSEFCELVFGPKISKAVCFGYVAIARIRNHDVNGDTAFLSDYLGAGTDNPEEDAWIAREALENLKDITIDGSWVSKIPMAVERKEILDDLKDHLKMVYQYAVFRTEYVKLAKQKRIYPDDLRKLPRIEKLKVSGGMIEWRKAQLFLRMNQKK